MKKIILGIVLIAISGVIAWNGAEISTKNESMYIFLSVICMFTAFYGALFLIFGIIDSNK